MVKGWKRKVLLTIAVSMSLFHLYTGGFGSLEGFLQRIVHLAFSFSLLFLTDLFSSHPEKVEESTVKRKAGFVPLLWFRQAYTVLLLVFLAVPLGYLLWNYDFIARERFAYVSGLSTLQIVLGIAFVWVTIEAARRTMGTAIAVIALVFVAYPWLGPYLPGILHHQGYSTEIVLDVLFFTTDGIFGIALGVSATFVVLFIIFSAFLEVIGFGDFMMALAKGLAGGLRGGPAKMSILASGLIGMISGSSVANVMTVGTFTIPLMKKTGYSKNFSGAVEAAASAGGQFMPPIMGAQAFIMAQFTGVPYIKIIWYSLLPAIFFYMGLWFNLDMEARRLKLAGLSRSELGDWKLEIWRGWHLALPMFLMVALLFLGRTPMFAAFWSVLGLVAVAQLRAHTRGRFDRIIEALRRGANVSMTVVAATAVSGIIIASVTLTGLGDRFSNATVELAQGHLFFGLFFAMIAALVLGMGLPTVPAYIVQISLVVPSLVEMGLEPFVAHLFVIYFSCISMITPPVAIAAYAAAGISGGDGFRTGVLSSRMAAVAYIVPFMFVYDPALLLIGDPLHIFLKAATTVAGVFALALALQGHFFRRCTAWERLMAGLAAVLMIPPYLTAGALGVFLVGFVLFLQRPDGKRGSKVPAPAAGE